MSARVVSSAALPIDAVTWFPAGTHYVCPDSGSFSRPRLLRELAGADALIALLDVRVDDELLAAAPGLQIAANVAVGFDNIDRVACARRGVTVTNTPDVLTETTADFAFALMLAAARRLVEGDALVQRRAWQGWALDHMLGRDVAGATLGLIGFGRIGQAVARRAAGFGMRVLYSAPRPGASEPPARHVPLAELLAESDFVSLHCPATPATRHIIDGAALARMKPTAILVNTARGACVDEAALVAALAEGRPGGAALDVFEREPEVHPGLLGDRRVVLAPHLGSATVATRTRMATVAVESVADVLAGRRPRHVVAPPEVKA